MAEDVVTTEKVEDTTTDVVVEETVSKSELNKVLDEVHKWKNKYKDTEKQLKQREVDEMKKREDWQKIAELKEKEAKDALEENENIKKSMAFDKKFNAIKSAAISAGLRKEAIEDLFLLDFDDVQLETTSTGRINVLNVDKSVDRLKTLRPHWFSKKPISVNGEIPNVVDKDKITYQDVIKAEEFAKKTGNYSDYRDTLLKYKKQL